MIARLAILVVRPDYSKCHDCKSRECIKGTNLDQGLLGASAICPTFQNPRALDSNRLCLQCWKCFKNCPEKKSSLKIHFGFPGHELFTPIAPDKWEVLILGALFGMFYTDAWADVTATASINGGPGGLRVHGFSAAPNFLYLAKTLGLALNPVVHGNTVTYDLHIFYIVAMAGLCLLGLSIFYGLALVSSKIAGVSFEKGISYGYMTLPLIFGWSQATLASPFWYFLHLYNPVNYIAVPLSAVWSLVVGYKLFTNPNNAANRTRGILASLPWVAFVVLGAMQWLGVNGLWTPWIPLKFLA